MYTLPRSHQDLLAQLGYKKKLDEVDSAILANANFLGKIVDNPEIFGHDIDSNGGKDHTEGPDTRVAASQHVHGSPGVWTILIR